MGSKIILHSVNLSKAVSKIWAASRRVKLFYVFRRREGSATRASPAVALPGRSQAEGGQGVGVLEPDPTLTPTAADLPYKVHFSRSFLAFN